MKTTSKVLALVTILTISSQGATVISGALGSAFKTSDGTTNIPTGSLVMLIADTDNNGFLNLATGGAVAPSLTGLSGKTITAAQAGLTAGSLFGGDTIVTTTLSGSSGSISSFMPTPGTDISSYTSLKFAVVWFTAAPATVTSSLAGQAFGMIRLADWVFPGSDGGTFALSTTDGSGANGYWSSSTATTANQVGVGVGFFTGSGTAANTGSTAVRSAEFEVAAAIPEPSAALLGALGVLGLLRRRRI